MISSKKLLTNTSQLIINKLFYDLESNDKKIIKLGIELFISTLFSLVMIMIVSALFGITKLALISGLSAGILKMYSGGVHSKTPFRCALTGAIIFTANGLIANNFQLNITFMWFTLIIGGLIIYLYAPEDVKEKRIFDKNKKMRLKIISYLIFFTLIFIQFILLTQQTYTNLAFASLLGVMWQLFATTPIAYKLFNR